MKFVPIIVVGLIILLIFIIINAIASIKDKIVYKNELWAIRKSIISKYSKVTMKISKSKIVYKNKDVCLSLRDLYSHFEENILYKTTTHQSLVKHLTKFAKKNGDELNIIKKTKLLKMSICGYKKQLERRKCCDEILNVIGIIPFFSKRICKDKNSHVQYYNLKFILNKRQKPNCYITIRGKDS